MRRAALLAAVVLAAVTGCGGRHHAASSTQPARLTDLRSVDQLRTLFNAHAGEPRLVVLVSPT